MQSEKTLGQRKDAKAAAVAIAVAVVVLSLFAPYDWTAVGLYRDAPLPSRLAYPFFHASLIHACVNAWCLLSVVFLCEVSLWRMAVAYAVAVSVPVGLLSFAFHFPTVGLSAVVYFLLGYVSVSAARKALFHSWIMFFIAIGFLFPQVNAVLHLYCYVAGIADGLLNLPIQWKRR